METSDQLDERKPKTVRVRKRIVIDPNEASGTKRNRIIRIARNIVVDPLIHGPLPGSIEEDFLLERDGDPRSFLKVTLPSSNEVAFFGPRYYQEGKLVPYSVVGPPDLFEKQHTAEMKTRSLEDKPSSDVGSDTAVRRPMFMSIRKVNKTPSETPEQRFQARTAKIEEGKKKDAAEESARVRALPIGLKIIEDRHRKCLREFSQAQAHWDLLSANLAAKANKTAEMLVLNQHQVFREKLEEMDYLDRALTTEEKAGPNGWYMSLRADKSGNFIRGGYLPVGNLFSGIYAQIRDRTQSAEAMIRRPMLKGMTKREATIEEEGENDTKMTTSRKTFRDYPYFQQRMKEEETKRSLHPVQATNPTSLWVQGESKYQAELRALKSLGLEQLRPELLRTGELTEESIDEHYDIKFKY